MIKEAMQFLTKLKEEAMEPKVVEINGRTYCDKTLTRYDEENMARAIEASTLTAMVDYIKNCKEELRENMIIHVTDPRTVKLYSGLTKERKREYLFQSFLQSYQNSISMNGMIRNASLLSCRQTLK